MKKLNNKGFAISTLIYGLAIMGIMIVAILIATMAKTRSNNTSIVKAIEEDLNRFSRTQTTFKPIDAGITETNPIPSQEYIVPSDGWYRIELWGTQGGGPSGGKGAYTSGVIELSKGDTLYFYVGKHKSEVSGGYSTEVRILNGEYSDKISYETRIMVAGGGGANETASGGTLYGYSSDMISYGGYIDSVRNTSSFSLPSSSVDEEEGQTEEQTEVTTDPNDKTNGTLIGYAKEYQVSDIPTTNAIERIKAEAGALPLPVYPPNGSNGGGYGYFPSDKASAGGSSYIAGYAGCFGITKGILVNNSKLSLYERSWTEDDANSGNAFAEDAPLIGEFHFVDGMMLPGVKTGDGFAKIERVLSKNNSEITLERRNKKLNGIKYIRDCTDNGTVREINASIKGVTLRNLQRVLIDSKCTTVSLGDEADSYDVDEIVVFHTETGKDYIKDEISVSTDGTTWTLIKGKEDKSEPELSETETVTGYRVSAYQSDSLEPLKNGTYIIQPVLSENKVLTAAATLETNGDALTIEPYVGEKRQKWTIELITDKRISPGYVENNPTTYEYKIVETSRSKALAIKEDENVVLNNLTAITAFNTKSRNEPQIWKITPAGNGTYVIETVVPQISAKADTGYLIAQTNNTTIENFEHVIIGKRNIETARFKLIQTDYSSN